MHTRLIYACTLSIIPLVLSFHSAAENMNHSMMDMPEMQSHAAPALSIADMPKGQRLRNLPLLKNQSHEPGLFQGKLTAAITPVEFIPHLKATAWSYNHALPGPLIEVTEGDRIEVQLNNQLNQPTTIHWHGLPLPPEQDGNPMDPVLPGHSHTYRFSLPADSAGTYWYHPHPHQYTAEQVYQGLAGPLIVKPKDDHLKNIPERNLMISDLKLTEAGTIAANDMNDWMNGREGQFVLINGQWQPRLLMHSTEHWRIWNATSARYLQLTLGKQSFTLVGTDGGLIEKPVHGLTHILLAPAERIEIIVDPVRQGQVVQLSAQTYHRGKMGNVAPETDIPLLTVQSAPDSRMIRIPEQLRTIPAPEKTSVVKQFVFSEIMSMANGQHSMAFLINGKAFDMHRIDITSKLHQPEIWEITNNTDMDHPFHVHGTQFQLLDVTDHNIRTPAPYRAWKDTVNIGRGQTVRIELKQDFPGLRMYHCHILEHEVLGMMGMQLAK